MLAAGWSGQELRAVLAASPTASDAPDPAEQAKRWRSALKQAFPLSLRHPDHR